MKLNCGAKRHHYSMFKVERSMFDVQSVLCSLIRTCLYIVAIIGFYGVPIYAQTPSNPGTLPSPSDHSENPSFWSNIDTHWGGRLKTSGRVSQTDDDTIFEPVGTGTYWDGSFNFRLINETFFSDSVFTEIAYELIGAGGDTVRKTNELKNKNGRPEEPPPYFYILTEFYYYPVE